MSSLMEPVSGSNVTYLKIIKGSFRQEVEAGTPGAKTREWEAAGNSGVKHELIWKNLRGIIDSVLIDDVTFNDGKAIQVLKVRVTNGDEAAQFSTQTNSRFAIDFMKKLPNIKPGVEVSINPYDFEPKPGEKKTGMNIVQDGEKIYSAYWDNEKKKPLKGIPVVEDSTGFDSDDWKMHFVKEKKFLVKETIKLSPNFVSVKAETVPPTEEGEQDGLPF